MKSRFRRATPFYGFFGFFGCFGFRYFYSHDMGDLFYFSFFAFFAYFIVGKLMREMPDERLLANSNKAAARTLYIPTLALFLIGFGATKPFGTKEFIVLISAVAWALSMLTYAALFYYYDKR